MMPGIHGILLMATAILHIAFGLLPNIYGKDWHGFKKLCFWKAVWIDDDRSMAAFWFVIFGPVLFLSGLSVYEIETAGLALPTSIGWTLFVISMVGAVMSPKSGFSTLLLPQAIFFLYSAFH